MILHDCDIDEFLHRAYWLFVNIQNKMNIKKLYILLLAQLAVATSGNLLKEETGH